MVSEADRLLAIVIDNYSSKINDYLVDIGKEVNQQVYNAILDLVYNRGLNAMTKEIIVAMADGDDELVSELLDQFDYKYAIRYLNCSEEEAISFVNRNPGLLTRRNAEYNMYKYGGTE